MSSVDTIIIGAGHNGLAAACALGKAGHKVLVLEARSQVGGLSGGEEFHAGYRHTGLLHDTSCVHPAVADALNLSVSYDHGAPELLALGPENASIQLGGTMEQVAAEIGKVSSHDAKSYKEFRAFVEELRPVLSAFRNEHPVDLLDVESVGVWTLFRRALQVRRLGRKSMMELLRLPPMPAADWLSEYFETDFLKCALALPAVAATCTGPRAPSSTMNLLLHLGGSQATIAGGPKALLDALEASVASLGGTIQTGTRVASLDVEKGKIRGVVTDSGEKIGAHRVVSATDPKSTMLNLLPKGHLPFRDTAHLAHFRARGTTGHVFLALSSAPKFTSEPDSPVRFARTGDHLNSLEKAHDATKYGEVAERPVLDIYVPTLDYPDLAPEGHGVLSVGVHFAPHIHKDGWNDSTREALASTVISELDRYAPGIKDSIVGKDVLSPADIEERYGISGGNIHHGEHAIDQLLVRPTPACSGYSTPIDGLWLCGSGSHPGGGLSCAPGTLAARAIVERG